MIKDVFKNNLLNMNVIDHNKFKLELLNLPSNYYPEIELNLILSIFPSLDLTYDLLDEDTDNRE